MKYEGGRGSNWPPPGKSTLKKPSLIRVNEWTEAAIEEGFLRKQIFKSSYRRCSIKKGALTNFAKFIRNNCARLKLQTSARNFVKKETLTQEFSCEFCQIFENTFFTEHLWTTDKISVLSSWFNRVSSWLHDWNLQKMSVKKSSFKKLYCVKSVQRRSFF